MLRKTFLAASLVAVLGVLAGLLGQIFASYPGDPMEGFSGMG